MIKIKHWQLYLILFIALVLRMPLLNESFWMDEAAQALEITRPLSQQLNIANDFQPPLLHLILHFAQYFSVSEWWLRTIGALIPGLITIYFSYKLTLKLFNKNVAILSSLLLATSSFHIFYSQELRPYSLSTMLAIISMYLFIQILEQKSIESHPKKENQKIKRQEITNQNKNHLFKFNKNSLGFRLSIINLLGLYSSYLFPFLIICQLVFIFIKDVVQAISKTTNKTINEKLKNSKKELKFAKSNTWLTLFKTKEFPLTLNYLNSLIIPILGFLPWLPMFLKQLKTGQQTRINLPGWENVVSISQLKSTPLVFGKFIFGVLNIEFNQFFVIFGALVLLPLVILLIAKLTEPISSKKLSIQKYLLTIFQKNNPIKEKENFLLILFWLVIPLLTTWLISFIIPVVRPKRLLYLLPAFYILIAFLIDEFLFNKILAKTFSKKIKKIYFVLAITILLSMFSINIFSTLGYYTNPKLQRENWKGLYQNIIKDFRPSSTIIIYSFPNKFAPMEWYSNLKYNPVATKYPAIATKYPSITTGKLSIDNVNDLAGTLKRVVEYDNVLVFDYLRDLSDPNKKIEKELINFGFKEVGVLDYPNIGFVRIFAKPHSIISMVN